MINLKKKLPALNALRVFETAAEFENFRMAADELYLSIGSVSRFVAQLEDDLGVKLFERYSRGARLTEKGRLYFDEISPALNQLREASERLRPKSTYGNNFTLWASQSLGTNWLLPRFNILNKTAENFKLKLAISTEFPDVVAEKIDFVLSSDYKHILEPQLLSSIPIYQESLTLVCSKSLLKENELIHPENIPENSLLPVHSMLNEWKQWLCAVERDNINIENCTMFDTSLGALQAVKNGLGFTLGERLVVADQISKGELIAPFIAQTFLGDEVKLFWRKNSRIDPIAIELSDYLKNMVTETTGP